MSSVPTPFDPAGEARCSDRKSAKHICMHIWRSFMPQASVWAVANAFLASSSAFDPGAHDQG